jgi:gamma-glutamylcyclotransferase (GGCT)/AIG2-like uncharacterized protein YtfP
MHALFAYGTLQHPDILRPVLGRIPPSAPGRLEHYARYLIHNADYPGIVSQPGASTPGTLYFEISDPEWQRLDKYESDLYVRLSVQVITDEGHTVPAFAYVIPDAHRHHLTDLPWELHSYRPRHLLGPA